MTLFLVGTPIGNLEDITLRAIRILGESDLILCEDTRTSRVLLNHIGVKKDLVSYHKFNERRQEEFILEELGAGKKLCLISDAGMPTIADPGQNLVHLCRQHGFKVEVIPGPSSPITALAGSGWGADHFQFIGFIPKKSGQTKNLFAKICLYDGITIAFETKHRLLKTLVIMKEENYPLEVCLTKELTKIFEVYFFGKASQIIQQLQNKSLKGEFVILFRRAKDEPDVTL